MKHHTRRRRKSHRRKSLGRKSLRSCCTAVATTKTCKRKDGKLFKLPRRFSKKTCLTKKVRGFTMKSSCAPFKYCKKRTNVKAKSRKNKKN